MHWLFWLASPLKNLVFQRPARKWLDTHLKARSEQRSTLNHIIKMKTPRQLLCSTTVRLGLILITVGLASFEEKAQPSSVPLASFWRTDGPVYTIVVKTNTAYIGGQFTYVGPDTGVARAWWTPPPPPASGPFRS